MLNNQIRVTVPRELLEKNFQGVAVGVLNLMDTIAKVHEQEVTFYIEETAKDFENNEVTYTGTFSRQHRTHGSPYDV